MAFNTKTNLQYKECIVGAITLPHVTKLQATKAIDGLMLRIPAEIEIRKHDRIAGHPMVSGVRAAVSCFGEHVGRMEDARSFIPGANWDLDWVLRLSPPVIRELERRRNGNALTFTIDVEAQSCAVRHVAIFDKKSDERDDLVERFTPRTENGRPAICPVQGEPLQSRTGTLEFTCNPQVWSDMLTATGFGENVFVEIPLPQNPGPPWDEVWRALRNARDQLNRGGHNAWKGIINECRTALEKWRDIEEPDLGPGLPQPNQQDRANRSWDQRLDQLRWHLHHLTHVGVHGHADDYDRQEAVLVLATLAGLLAVRNP